MSRVKRGMATKKRHKRLLNQTKGFWGQRKNVFRRASETLIRAQAFAYKGRKLEKRTMRSLFITRINAALDGLGISYARFIHALQGSHILINRKMLSQLAIFDPTAFSQVVSLAKEANC